MQKKHVLFVCLGNICRSPMAESIFVDLVTKAGRRDQFVIESAGTGDWHVGAEPDQRTIATLARRGIDWASRARQIAPSDFQRFDRILAMDSANHRDLLKLGGTLEQVRLMLDYDPEAPTQEVPDPYYGSKRDFEHVFDLLLPACEGLLADLKD